jgi:hypothetical protein
VYEKFPSACLLLQLAEDRWSDNVAGHQKNLLSLEEKS